MASFNLINDDCILLILIRIALSSRISLRLICRRWKSLFESQCRKVRELRLTGPIHYLDQEKPGLFPSEYFVKHFCEVQKLNIEINRNGTLQYYFASIFQCWLSTLTHLSIDNLPRDPGSLLNEPEWILLNKMTKLESLHLSNMIRHQVPHPKYLSFVGQLKCLSFKGYNAAHLISLIYSIGSELRDLRLEIEYYRFGDLGMFSLDVLENVFEDCRKMTSGVTRLKIDHPCKHDFDSKVKFGNMVCDHFCSVTELDFLPEIPMQLMLPHLASLSNLTKLCLTLHEQTDFNHFTHDCILESVKFLSLNVSSIGITKLSNILKQICGLIATIFPKLDEFLVIVDAHNTTSIMKELKEIVENVSSCKVRVEADPK